MTYLRPIVTELLKFFEHRPPLLHVLIGPRQVGKTTAADQVVERLGWPSHSVTADSPVPHPPQWIEAQWEIARKISPKRRTILVLDEIQKVFGWSEVVKKLWDDEIRTKGLVRPLLLGSSVLLLERGLSESLAGRFFLHRCSHWEWTECRRAFSWDLDRWLYFGGYPGAAPFVEDEILWKRYVTDSLVETVLARDVLQLQTINKPALLRSLFGFAASHPAQIFSYNKMLGQLHDAGNTTTLAHYLHLLSQAFLLSGLELFSKGKKRRRGSSPKLIAWNNALVNSLSLLSFREARNDPSWWGRLVENAVGAHLLNSLHSPQWEITYWRDGDTEIDFVVQHGSKIWIFEVKSGSSARVSGLQAFKKRYNEAVPLIVGSGGIPLEEFFSHGPEKWL